MDFLKIRKDSLAALTYFRTSPNVVKIEGLGDAYMACFRGTDTISKNNIIVDRPEEIPLEIWNNSVIKDRDLAYSYLIDTTQRYDRIVAYIKFANYTVILPVAKPLYWIIIDNNCSISYYEAVSANGVSDKILNQTSQRNYSDMLEFYEAAKDMHGEENVCLYYFIDPESCFYTNIISNAVVIHYPELWIEDCEGLKVRTKGNYVIINFNYTDGSIISELRLVRTKIEYNQLICGYKHSHVASTSNFENTAKFCLGAGTMPDAFNLIFSEFNEINIYNLLLTINAFLVWEDLDGGPYILIRDVFLNSNQEGSEMSYSRLLTLVKNKEVDILHNIIDDEVIIDVDMNQIRNINSEEGTEAYRLHSDGGLYSNNKLTTPIDLSQTNIYIYFNGVKIDVEAYSDLSDYAFSEALNTGADIISSSVPSNSTIKLLLDKIKSNLNNKLINKYEIQSYVKKFNIEKRLIGLTKIYRNT